MMQKNYGINLEEKTAEVLRGTEKLVEVAYKASGRSVMDLFGNLDAETGACVGAAMTVYNGAKDLAVMQAKAMDLIITNFEELEKMNRELCEQNERLLKLQEEILKEVKKD